MHYSAGAAELAGGVHGRAGGQGLLEAKDGQAGPKAGNIIGFTWLTGKLPFF